MAYPAKPIPAYPWSPSCDPYIHPNIQVLSYHAPPSYKMPPSAFAHIYPCDPSYAYFQGASSRLSEYYSVAFSNMKPSPTFEPAYIPLHHGDPRAFTSQAAEFALKEAGIVSSSPSTPPFSTADLSFSCGSTSCGSTDMSSVMSPFSSPSSTLSRSPSQYFTPLTSSFSKSEMSYPFEDAYPQAQGYNTTFESVPEDSYSFLPLKLERPSAAERIRIAEALNMKSIFSAQVDDHEDNAFERIELDYGSSSEEEEIIQGREVGQDNSCGKFDPLDFRCRGE